MLTSVGLLTTEVRDPMSVSEQLRDRDGARFESSFLPKIIYSWAVVVV